MKRYNALFFKSKLPEWKKKRDPIPVRYIYRPISFYCAAFCANHGIKANDVSNFSTIIGMIACVLLAIPSYVSGIVGGLFLNAWIILDCTDGNLARNVEKQAYGEFLDAMSSYLLIGFLYISLGYRSYYINEIIHIQNNIYLLLGALCSIFGTLMSLLYQKFVLVSKDLGFEEKLSYDGSNSNSLMKLKTTIDMNLSVGGVLPLLITFSCMFRFTEVLIILWFVYYLFEFIATVVYFVIKTQRYNNTEV